MALAVWRPMLSVDESGVVKIAVNFYTSFHAHTMHLCGKIGVGMGTLLNTGNANSHRPHCDVINSDPALRCVSSADHKASRSKVYDAVSRFALCQL